MRRRRESRESWQEIFRGLGSAIFEVFQAEVAVLLAEWKRSLRLLLIAAGLAAFILSLLFWWVALVLFAVVDFVGRWLHEPWQAALAVAGLVLVLIAAAAVGAWLALQKFDLFQATRRRFEEHVAWWQERFLRQDLGLTEGEEIDERPDEGP